MVFKEENMRIDSSSLALSSRFVSTENTERTTDISITRPDTIERIQTHEKRIEHLSGMSSFSQDETGVVTQVDIQERYTENNYRQKNENTYVKPSIKDLLTQKMQALQKISAPEKTEGAQKVEQTLTPKDKMILDLLAGLSKRSLGKTVKRALPPSIEQRTISAINLEKKDITHVEQHVPATSQPPALPTYTKVKTIELRESSRMSFSAKGEVHTSDGKTINLDIRLHLSREVEAKIQTYEEGSWSDPLVVNFNAPSTQLLERKIDFDLTSNGEVEHISMVGKGSGFIAYDKNGNGKIDNGSELFGPTSGDAFAELAEYDEDGNGWIDENDSIYTNLQIWVGDEEGQSRLLNLAEAGVGAFFLGKVTSSYTLKDEHYNALAQIKESSVALMEDGKAVTLQSIDISA